jgi:hypothetical protein
MGIIFHSSLFFEQFCVMGYVHRSSTCNFTGQFFPLSKFISALENEHNLRVFGWPYKRIVDFWSDLERPEVRERRRGAVKEVSCQCGPRIKERI